MKKIGTLLLGLALGAGAPAATVSYDFSSEEALTDFQYTGRLGLFDSTLGALTGATLELYGEFTSAYWVRNTGETRMRGTRVRTEGGLLFGSSLPELNALVTRRNGAPLLSWSRNSGAFPVGAGKTRYFDPVTESGVVSFDLVDLLSVLAAPGGGGLDLTCASRTRTSVSLGGSATFGQTSTAACGAYLTYTYDELTSGWDTGPLSGPMGAPMGAPMGEVLTGPAGLPAASTNPVDEPASLTLATLGLACLVARSRKNRRAVHENSLA